MKTADKKLARQLQKRGKWNSYSSCLREVQRALKDRMMEPQAARLVSEAIDRGDLDPKERS